MSPLRETCVTRSLTIQWMRFKIGLWKPSESFWSWISQENSAKRKFENLIGKTSLKTELFKNIINSISYH